MASRWFYKMLGEEWGPQGFQELRAMVRSGTLLEGDLVRREGTDLWMRADQVTGLFHDKDLPMEAEPEELGLNAEPAAPPPIRPPLRKPWFRKLHLDRTEWLILLAGVVVFILVNLLAWQAELREAARYPLSRLRGRGATDKEALATVLGPPPKEPSVPGLKERAPRPVPGLERIRGVTSLSLSADLRTIVFSAPGSPETGYDLFVTERKDASDPFGWPVLIETCVGPEREDAPAVSPNGLMLVFVRHAPDPQFWLCTRFGIESEFGTPFQWPVPGLNPARQRLGQPQFLDDEHLVFTIHDRAGGPTRFYVAKRNSFSFDKPEALATSRLGQGWLTKDQLRCYLGTSSGLLLSVRRGPREGFTGSRCILASDLIGPIATRVWVAPQEDVVFYCSPGPNRSGRGQNSLWMARYY
jgi:hypothetical protein